MGSYGDAISDEIREDDMHIVSDMNGLYVESEDGFVGDEEHIERSVLSVDQA